MSATRRYILQHTFAALLGSPFLLLVWVLVNPLITVLQTGAYPVEPFPPEAFFFNFCCFSAMLVLFFIPLSTLADMLLVRRLSLRFWIRFPIVTLAMIFTQLTFWWLIVIVGNGDDAAIFIGSLDYSIMGTVYWLLFTLGGYLLGKIAKFAKEPGED